MSRIVMKFGGTSVADVDRIIHAAAHVMREITAGNQVAVVVSAMAGTTNQLLAWGEEVSDKSRAMLGDIAAAPRRALSSQAGGERAEMDAVAAAGEQITSGLMAMALQGAGINARSWLGWQIPVRTDANHTMAKISTYDAHLLSADMEAGGCPVVAGFQGVTMQNRITTYGRGGSDLSAVALAVALQADRCDIYTDVDGVYTADPRYFKQARRIHRLSFETMLELASAGSKVIQTRAVRLARAHSLPLMVCSTFNSIDDTDDEGNPRGTLICHKRQLMERLAVNSITCDSEQAQITLRQVDDRPGVAAAVFAPLGAADVFVDMIAQSISSSNTTDMSFTVAAGDCERALAILEERQENIGYRRIRHDTDVAKVTVIGDGMLVYSGVVGKMFDALAKEGINILLITTSEIRISVLVHAENARRAVVCLHSAFDLDNGGVD